MTTLPGPDALAQGLTSLTASSPFDGGCLPCQERAQGVSTNASYGDDPNTVDEVDTDAPSDPSLIPWQGVLGVEGEMTGDGRMIAENALRVDDFPIPLRHVSSDIGGHDGAVTVGTIENVERESTDDGRVLLVGNGYLDLNSPAGPEAVRGILSGSQPGVSLDLDSVSFEVHVAEELVNKANAAKDGGDGEVEIPRTEDGAYIVSKVSASDEVMLTTDGRIRAATLVAIPAFASAKITLDDPDAVRETLTASGHATDLTDYADTDDFDSVQVFNWVQDAGGLPSYVQRIVKHLQEKGMTESHAIATAINVCKKACSTGDVNFPGVQHENAASQAEACEAVDHWEAMKASHAAHSLAFAFESDDTDDAPTVSDETQEIDTDSVGEDVECAYPECDAPAVFLVPLIDGIDEPVDPDEEDDDPDSVPYCQDHTSMILEEIGDLGLTDDSDDSAGDSDTGDADDGGYSDTSETFDIVHAPAGSPIGGQFISPSGASSSDSQTKEAQQQADQQTIDELSKLSAKALQEVMQNLQTAMQGMSNGDAKTELQHLIGDVKQAQANVAATAKSAKSGKSGSGSGSSKGKSGKSGSSKSSAKGKGKSSGGSGSSKGKSSTAAKAKASKEKAAAKAAKAKAAAEKKAASAKAKAEKAKARQDAKDKRDSERAAKLVEREAVKVAKAHAAEIAHTKMQLNGYYKKFHQKISPEERGEIQKSIDTCTATLNKLESPDYLTAGAAPDAPPAEWFRDPGLTEPTALTITPEGRVYGHLAAWNTCHTSHTAQGQCVLAPRTQTDYAYFHTGAVLTAEGTEQRVGHITMDTRHAGGSLGPAATMSHYEDTGTVIADVACGEDMHGIWFSGALRPWATDKQVRMLRSSPLSGDWRRAGNGLELVAALAVNVPGFPVPRPQGLVASGHVQSLIAGGMIAPSSITDTVTASGVDDPASQMDARPNPQVEGEGSGLGTGPAPTPGNVTPTVADHLSPEDLAFLKGLAQKERDTFRSEADKIAREMFATQARELAEEMRTF